MEKYEVGETWKGKNGFEYYIVGYAKEGGFVLESLQASEKERRFFSPESDASFWLHKQV